MLGANIAGQLGDGTTIQRTTPVQVVALGSSVTDVAPGEFHTCARKTDASLWCWGSNYYGQFGDGTKSGAIVTTPVKATGPVARITVGFDQTCAIRANGALYCWGHNTFGSWQTI